MNDRTKAKRFGRVAGLAVLTASLALTGCDLDSLLEVNDPETVPPENLENPELIEEIVAGAKGEFTGGYSGSGLSDNYLAVSAAITDEWHSTGTFGTRTATDRRLQFAPDDGNTSDAAYVNLQQARLALSHAAERLANMEDFGPTDAEYGEVKALEGFTMVALAEGFCSAIPLSHLPLNGVYPYDVTYGSPLSGRAVLDSAITRFEAALGVENNYLAMVGLGRALLAQGDAAAAAAAVAGVPTDWEYFLGHSNSGQPNPIYNLQGNGRWSVSDEEGGEGLPFREAMDPRNPWWEDPDGGFDAAYPLYVSYRGYEENYPVVLASGVEARLIEAEAALQAGDYPAMTQILNDLRDQVSSVMSDWVEGWATFVADEGFPTTLPDLAVPTTQAGAIDQLFYERGFWLYLTGHRLGDLRRLVYEYGREKENVYPSGEYHKGGTYGDDAAFPVDYNEVTNPEYTFDACNVDDPGID